MMGYVVGGLEARLCELYITLPKDEELWSLSEVGE